MRFLIINETSRGEFDSYVGSLKNIDELVDSWYEERKNLVLEGETNEFMDLQFGGISDKNCFLELSFDEEDHYMVYVLHNVNEDYVNVSTDKWNIIDWKDYHTYELVRCS